MKILFVNACVRGEASNTLKLCRAALDALCAVHPEAGVEEVNLVEERPAPPYEAQTAQRASLRHAGHWEAHTLPHDRSSPRAS